jgi:RNA polymerase sigma factor (sigma-70 family)
MPFELFFYVGSIIVPVMYFYKSVTNGCLLSLSNVIVLFLNLEKLNSDELIALCRKDNQRAQFEIYKRYSKAMYNTAFRIVNDTVLAEEATQEGFIIAFRKLNQYRNENRFGGWLKKIVSRKSFEYYKEKHQLLRLEDRPEVPELQIETNNLSSSDQSQSLLRAMEKLRPNDQLLLRLYYLEGYDYEELSQVLDINYGNCRTRLSRAKSKLKKILNDE